MKGKGKPKKQDAVKPPKMSAGLMQMKQAMMGRKSGKRGQ